MLPSKFISPAAAQFLFKDDSKHHDSPINPRVLKESMTKATPCTLPLWSQMVFYLAAFSQTQVFIPHPFLCSLSIRGRSRRKIRTMSYHQTTIVYKNSPDSYTTTSFLSPSRNFHANMSTLSFLFVFLNKVNIYHIFDS